MNEVSKSTPPKQSVAPNVVSLGLLVLLTMIVAGFQCFATTNQTGVLPGNSTAILVNLNTATVSELRLLPGVGEKLANDIIEHRESVGSFRRSDDLMKIAGIKSARFEQLRSFVFVADERSTDEEIPEVDGKRDHRAYSEED